MGKREKKLRKELKVTVKKFVEDKANDGINKIAKENMQLKKDIKIAKDEKLQKTILSCGFTCFAAVLLAWTIYELICRYISHQ